MSQKRRKAKKKRQPPVRPKRAISSQQKERLRQAAQAHATGNLGYAEAEYRALVAENVRIPELYCNLARICTTSKRLSEATELWEKAWTLDPGNVEAGMGLADNYQQAGKVEQAERVYKRLIAAGQRKVMASYALANLLKAQGKLDEAREIYQQIMARQPDYTQAHFTYSGIHKYQHRSDPHIDLMLELYGRDSVSSENRIHLAFALAKAFEDIGEYAQAFTYLAAGNQLRNREFDYDIESDRALIRSIMDQFTPQAMSQLDINAASSDRPIFIVGMPRSGTSLVEKIIASHSSVHGAGELEYIFALGAGIFLKRSPVFEFTALDGYPASAYETFGKTYLEQIALLDDSASHVSDKMPFNMMMIGLIRIALPNAKIIHCVRDARDTCLSIYKQNFTTANYRFAYDLKAIGQFHNQYRKLMAHWHAAMPGVIYDVVYEDLTSNPDEEIRKLLSACNLGFEEDCVKFDKSAGLVRTASSYQVRQPMYTSSVRLWEKYQAFLGPLLKVLDPD